MEIDLKLHRVTMGGGRVRSRKVKFCHFGLFQNQRPDHLPREGVSKSGNLVTMIRKNVKNTNNPIKIQSMAYKWLLRFNTRDTNVIIPDSMLTKTQESLRASLL